MVDLLQGWREEQRSAYLYRVLAQREPDAELAMMFSKLADAALMQAQVWQHKLSAAGYEVQAYHPDIRTRFVVLMLRALGPRRMRHVLAASKVRGLSAYGTKRIDLATHATPSQLHEVGGRHKMPGSNGGLRAAVFGVNDGLVSIACLVLGVAGAASQASVILLSGVAGLLAGAFSMAAGEYVSMRSQRELFEYQIALEREELALYPEQEAAELALIYEARGLTHDEAQKLAGRLVADPELGLDILTREELGLNPDELGSPWAAAGSSFISFLLGGMIPLLPWLLNVSEHALEIAFGLTGVALFIVGAMLALFSGRNMIYGGVRMLLIGAAAGGLTYWIGSLLGTGT
ncbi:VIT1/CCC1 transporter family protein [Methylobacillus arboreus]|uniref:VIT1/CCC1 transporter family protein n=1 Tax=Methylobacillus arboreus TaxID=755170 RepID=UPI001E3182E2|nr:VIT1/CCC1 transporter family protein [Methylobacillus arboreus]MCB5190733.1 VIT1/CCC1 transporter family protein [Methylobacillus arboreus]